MFGIVRIEGQSADARTLLSRWQRRHGGSGAVYQGQPSALLLTAETSIEALEELVDSFEGPGLVVEIIWRAEDSLRA